MAIIPTSLFFSKLKKYGVGALSFDLIMAEEHNLENVITAHNIESGSVITDHIQNELEGGTVTGLISNFSLNTFFISSNRSQDAFDLLYTIWKSKALVDIVTIYKTYTNVAITSAPVARDRDSAESIILQISFQKINIVTLQKVTLEIGIGINGLNTDIQKQISPGIDAGRAVGTPASVPIA